MTTLIALYGSAGLIGRCDEKCYGAIHPDCDCVCRGANHAKGLARAVDNTRQLAERWIAQAEGIKHAEVPDWVRTQPMFPELATA